MADIHISNIILLKLLDCMKNNQNYHFLTVPLTSCNVEYDKYDGLVEDVTRRDGRPTDHRAVTLNLIFIDCVCFA